MTIETFNGKRIGNPLVGVQLLGFREQFQDSEKFWYPPPTASISVIDTAESIGEVTQKRIRERDEKQL